MADSGDKKNPTTEQPSNVDETEEKIRSKEARENQLEKMENEAKIDELIRKMEELDEMDAIVECVPYLFLEDGYLEGLCENNIMCVFCQAEYKAWEKVTFFECGHMLHTWPCLAELRIKEEKDNEGLECLACKNTLKELGWFPYIGNSEMVEPPPPPAAGVEEEAPLTYPQPEWATLCKVCEDVWFYPAENVFYLRTCLCFYHVGCFEGVFQTASSISSVGACVGCGQFFEYLEDVVECQIEDGNFADWLAYGAVGQFAIAATGEGAAAGQEVEEGAEEIEEEEELYDQKKKMYL